MFYLCPGTFTVVRDKDIRYRILIMIDQDSEMILQKVTGGMSQIDKCKERQYTNWRKEHLSPGDKTTEIYQK